MLCFRTHKDNFALSKNCVLEYAIFFKYEYKPLMELKIKVGERISHLRNSKKLSQQKFSYEADMERTYLSHIEKGRKNISLSTLQKILTALDVSPKEFFETKEFDKE